ncbi:transcription factor GATA-4 [Eurytemora carolleeae]|uniref:transcription factor GATA-4 n=1 Tax=Eurytemora carolleeae TaxID=1294199 RepID=UPI000C763D5A|nr:transcription factor GATA-4 [Eurytemora carolleeae]|eukprot:XP_023324775.1 transcription factor GATA-4-like [Eurytemora affinis]
MQSRTKKSPGRRTDDEKKVSRKVWTQQDGVARKVRKYTRVGPDTRCLNCSTYSTTLWRRDSEGNPLCNPCGLHRKLHGEDRPIHLRKEKIRQRQKKRNLEKESPITDTENSLTGPYSVIISNPTYSTSTQDSTSTHLSSFSSPQQSYLISPTPLDFINPTQQQFSILSSSNPTFTIPVSTYTNPYEQSRTHWHEYNQDQSMCELKLYSVPETHDHSSSFSKQRSNSSMPLDSGFNLD